MATLRELLATGRPSVGCWLSIGGGIAGELMGRAGFDWVICDLQHGGMGWDTLLSTIQALELGGGRPLVRVGWNDPMQIMRAVDLGASGVIVPMVSDEAAARAAVRAIRYPPDGERSFGPVRSYYSAGSKSPEPPLCFAMIETAEALANLEAIAAVPGLDGLFVGPVDLALSLGLGPALVMPQAVLSAVETVVAACRRHGLIPGCASLGMANARVLADLGISFLPIGNDAVYLRRGMAADLAEAKAWPVAADGQKSA